MITRNKEFKSVLKAMLVAFFLAGSQVLALGMVLTQVGKRPAIDEMSTARRVPELKPEREFPVTPTLELVRL